MSWNSGGPWGSSGGSPGGSGNDKRPNRPENNNDGREDVVDIDAWLNKSKERLRRAFPDPKNNGSRFITYAIIGVAVLWLFSGFYQVSTNQVGVVLRFGKVARIENPGLRYHFPEPVERVILQDVTTTNQIKIGLRDRSGQSQDVEDESRMLTGDENIVEIDFAVFWRVKDPEEFLFNIRNPELTVKLASESAIREVVGRMEIQPILTEKRSEIEQETEALIQEMMDEYKAGIVITQVQLLNAAPPQPVVDAFNDVQRARADAERSRNEAEAYRNDITPRARGEVQKMLQDAEGYKQQVISLAKGEAARFQSVLTAYNEAREVTSTRLYFEAMEDVLSRANKIIIDPAAAKNGTVPYLPLTDLTRGSKTPPPAQQQQQQ
jgi:membrane protease subunit HflK